MQKVNKPVPDADDMRPEYDFSQLREVRPRGYYAAQANTPPKIEISLWENGLHSLWRGLEFYAEYRETDDTMMIKDAIMFLHHGIELLMKEILVRHSPYLIFEDLKVVPKKQKEADKLGIPIFFLPQAPRTISYDTAVERVEAFIKPSGLTDDLIDKLKRLTAVRNQLEHYAISEEKQVIEGLLVELIDPLVDLFEAELGSIKRNRPAYIVRIQQDFAREIQAYSYRPREREVYDVVQRFMGQKIPGRLFNLDDEVTLPTFRKYQLNYKVPGLPAHANRLRAVLFCESTDSRWIISTEFSVYTSRDQSLRLARFYGERTTATPWLIDFAIAEDENKALAKQLGVMLTGPAEWEELKRLIESPSDPPH